MKRQTLTLPLCGLVLSTMAGCTVYTRHEPAYASTTYASATVAEPAPVYVEQEPPAERVETLPPAPGPGYVQVRGHWRWEGRNWGWIGGRWEQHRQNEQWEEGRWERQGHGHVWHEGRWRRH